MSTKDRQQAKEIYKTFYYRQRYRRFWEESGKDHGAPTPEAVESDPALAASVYAEMEAIENAADKEASELLELSPARKRPRYADHAAAFLRSIQGK